MTEQTHTNNGSKPLRAILLVDVTSEYGFGQYVIREMIEQKSAFSRIGVYHDLDRETAAKALMLNRLAETGIEIVYGRGFGNSYSFKGFDCIMSFLGNHGLHLQPSLVDSAIAAGVRHIYPSEYGADVLVGQNWTQRYYFEKVRTRLHLEERGKELPELGWTCVLLGRLTE